MKRAEKVFYKNNRLGFDSWYQFISTIKYTDLQYYELTIRDYLVLFSYLKLLQK